MNPTSITYYLADRAAVGDYVAYDAGIWPDGQEYNSTWPRWYRQPGANWKNWGMFDGFTAGTDKGLSVGSYRYQAAFKGDTNGWRVLRKVGNGESGIVHLISAGTPVVYYATEDPSTVSQRLDDFCDKTFTNTELATRSRSVSISAYRDGYNDGTVIWGYRLSSSKLWFWYTNWNTDICCGYNNTYYDYDSENGDYTEPIGVRPVIYLKSGIKCSSSASESYLGQNCYSIYKP